MAKSRSRLTHLDAANRPTMVDVGDKAVTRREAVAEAWVLLPANVARELAGTGHRTKKGPVFDTAVIAGVQAAKRTHELIPFCHPLPLDSIKLEFEARGNRIRITCSVAVEHRTGVEMEALTAVNIACLTIYDMCKSVDRAMVISGVALWEKTGGRSGVYRRDGDELLAEIDGI